MDIFLPQMKLVKLIAIWKQICESNETSVMGLTQFLGKLEGTAQAILPERLQIWYLQQVQINVLKISDIYQEKLQLDWEAEEVN